MEQLKNAQEEVAQIDMLCDQTGEEIKAGEKFYVADGRVLSSKHFSI